MSLPETEFQAALARLGACDSGSVWVGARPAQQAWDDMERPDWMFWWVEKSGVAEDMKPTFVRIACEIARTVLHLVPAGELRTLRAIELAERWANGEQVSIRELESAWAGAAAGAAGAAGAGAAARAGAQKKHCDIVRKYIPTAPKL